MAVMFGMPPMLSLKRSSQSGTFTMTAAWQTVYEESCAQPYLFGGAEIDLTNMQALDSISVRIEKTIAPAGAWVVHDLETYVGVQPAAHMAVGISGMIDVYGIRISMQQTVGAFRNIDCEFVDAKRLGL
jgi:hypothetical protein